MRENNERTWKHPDLWVMSCLCRNGVKQWLLRVSWAENLCGPVKYSFAAFPWTARRFLTPTVVDRTLLSKTHLETCIPCGTFVHSCHDKLHSPETADSGRLTLSRISRPWFTPRWAERSDKATKKEGDGLWRGCSRKQTACWRSKTSFVFQY